MCLFRASCCSIDPIRYSYPSIKPDKIHIGDIVEVALSFVVYPLAKGRAKCTAVLKTITLIDGKYTRVCGPTRTEYCKQL